MAVNDLFEKLKAKLLNRQKEVTTEIKQTREEDPFIQEYKEDGFRNLDDPEEEATDTYEHEITSAITEDLNKEKKDINEALDNMKKGTYGICEVCGKKISEDRLKINPTSTKCIDCERKAEAK